MIQTIPPTFDGRRTIPSPEVTQLMFDMLQLGPKDKVLEVGTGSGSQTQVFAQSGAEIHSIELEPFIDACDHNGTNIYLHAGDGVIGIEAEAPFSAIVATGGVTFIPKAWIDQLSEGGLLVAPVGDSVCQRLTLFAKSQSELIPLRIAAYVRFQMLRCLPSDHKNAA